MFSTRPHAVPPLSHWDGFSGATSGTCDLSPAAVGQFEVELGQVRSCLIELQDAGLPVKQ